MSESTPPPARTPAEPHPQPPASSSVPPFTEPPTGPIAPVDPAAPPPAGPPPPPGGYPPPHRHEPSRLLRVAAWVGIVAGSVFIVAVVFFSGFFLGAHSGRGGWAGPHGGGPAMMHRHGPPPMFDFGPMTHPGPRFEFPGPGVGDYPRAPVPPPGPQGPPGPPR